jgi:leucyl-tRNA synthetase
MVAPLAPHLGEELWERMGHAESVAFEPFPDADPALLVEEEIEIAVQVNGKVRARIRIPTSATDADVEAAARAHEQVSAQLDGEKVAKVVVVPGRLVNFVLG